MKLFQQIFALLNKQDKRKMMLLVVFMLTGVILEGLGVGMVLPFIAMIISPGVVDKYQIFKAFYQFCGVTSHIEFIYVLCALIVGFFICKNIALYIIAYYQYRFIASLKARWNKSLLKYYLNKDYEFYFYSNTADLQRNIMRSVAAVTDGICISLIFLISEILVSFTIGIILVFANPVASFVILGAGLFLVLYYRLSTKEMEGKKAHYSHGDMIRWLNQSFSCLKELKVLGTEKWFVDKFHAANTEYEAVLVKYRMRLFKPKAYVETVLVIAMVGVILLSITHNKDMNNIIATLGLFAVAAFRVMPSVNKMANLITNIRNCEEPFKSVYDDLVAAEQLQNNSVKSEKQPFSSSIELNNIFYRYPGAEQDAIKGITLRIRKGSSVAFVGPSGSGKTTLVDLILGLLLPKRGQIRVDNVDINTSLDAWRKCIGYIPQDISLIDDTIINNVALGMDANAISEYDIWRALEVAQIADVVRELPEGLHTSIGENGIRLSGGQRQRLGIARAVYHNPEVLILDEATSALDSATESEFIKAVESISVDKTLIIITHRLSTVEKCDVIYTIENGMIINLQKKTQC